METKSENRWQGSEALSRFRQRAMDTIPRVGFVLGSGLGVLSERLTQTHPLPFREIPGWPGTTVPGHRGELLLGQWAGQTVLVFSGRLHFYEGHAWRNVVQPIHIAKELGIEILVLTNAAGGIRDDLQPGSVMTISDHIEWTRPKCWLHPGPGGISPPRPKPYSPRLIAYLEKAALLMGWNLPQGIYAQLTGPCYETPAEIRALKYWGADAVGMSTAREIQTGNDLGLECAALSLITNRAAGLSSGPIHHQEVLVTANQQKDRLGRLLENFLNGLGKE